MKIEIEKRQGQILGLLILCLTFLLLPYCGKRPVPSTSNTSSGLKPDETTKITVEKGRVKISRRDKTPTTTTLPREGSVTVIEGKDGEVKIRIKSAGFCFSPGIGLVAYSSVRPSLDLKLIYWNQFGLGVGVPLSQEWIKPYAAFMYQVSPAYAISVFGGYAVGGQIVGGLRISFR